MQPLKRISLNSLLVAAVASWTACGAPDPPDDGAAMFRGDPAHSGVYRAFGPVQNAKLLWTFQTKGPVRSSPAVTESTVFIGSTDGTLYAIDRGSGEVRWAADVGSPVSSSPAVAEGLVLFGSRSLIPSGRSKRIGYRSWFRDFPPGAGRSSLSTIWTTYLCRRLRRCWGSPSGRRNPDCHTVWDSYGGSYGFRTDAARL
jgi:hypothetical protein